MVGGVSMSRSGGKTSDLFAHPMLADELLYRWTKSVRAPILHP